MKSTDSTGRTREVSHRVGLARARRSHPVGVSLVGVLVAIVTLAVAIMLLIPMMQRARTSHPVLKDSTMLRAIHQGMVLWRQSNSDRYPSPSLLDVKNDTIAADVPESKDTMANILSILVFNGFFSPELLVSNSEVNPNIRIMNNYQYTSPTGAAAGDKSLALWDPALSVDFTNGKTGNVSYAMAIPGGSRAAQWKQNFSATRAMLGHRGPEIGSLRKGTAPGVEATVRNPSSNALRMLGDGSKWAGYIVYDDNHVDRETDLFAGGAAKYKDATGTLWNDCLFANEEDDPTDTNNYLGIFTTAGKETKDFTPIWD